MVMAVVVSGWKREREIYTEKEREGEGEGRKAAQLYSFRHLDS